MVMVDFNIQFVGIAAPAAHQLYLIIGTSSSGRRECCTSSEAVSGEEGRIETHLKESLPDGFDEDSPCECLAILFAEEGAVWFPEVSLEKVFECSDGTSWLSGCSGDVYEDTLLEGVCLRGWEYKDDVGWAFEAWDELDCLTG